MSTLEQQLMDIKEAEDKRFIKGARKDLLKAYAKNHFGDDYKIDMTKRVGDLRDQIINEIDRRLGNEKKESPDEIKVSPVLARKNIIFRKFTEDERHNVPPYDEVFNEDGTPKLVIALNNKTIWEPSPGMLSRLGIEFEPCDKDGIIRRKEDYDRYKRDSVRDSDGPA